jgi:hypothetical protein
MIQRFSLWTTPTGHSIRTCSAEDLIVLKAFANRPMALKFSQSLRKAISIPPLHLPSPDSLCPLCPLC